MLANQPPPAEPLSRLDEIKSCIESARARLVLIRPDQHVAWRGDAWPVDGGLFGQVTGQPQTVTA